MAAAKELLTELQLQAPVASVERSDVAANGAPAGEPEAWNANVAIYTPLQGHAPESTLR